MRFGWGLLPALLLAGILIPPVLAAGINLSVAQQEYFFTTGEPADIPVLADSTFPYGMNGTLQFSTDQQLQKAGTILISTRNRVSRITILPGRSFLNLSTGTASSPTDYRVHISFDYIDPAPVNVSLPEIIVHIGTSPSGTGTVQSPVISTSGPGSPDVPVTSSVHVVEKAVSVREQAGSDSTRQSSAAAGRPQLNQSEMLQQAADKARQEREASAFDAKLALDPLVLDVNRSLAAEGFVRQSLDEQPSDEENGTFQMVYRQGAGGKVVVQGSMMSGTVRSVREQAGTAINGSAILAANTSFQSFRAILAGEGYGHTETVVNRTLTDASLSALFTRTDGKNAFVNITAEGDHVTRVTLEKETGAMEPAAMIFPLIAAAVIAACIWFVYRKFCRKTGDNQAGIAGPVAELFDHRKEAGRLLAEARVAYDRRDRHDAYGIAGRALRLFLSYEYGDGTEASSGEVLALLSIPAGDIPDFSSILAQCDEVMFAKGDPDAGRFAAVLDRIRQAIAE
jgi:hypothetical protein